MRSADEKEDELTRRMMVNEAMNPPDQVPAEGISSPISAQILSFCDEDLFTETLRNSDVSSCYDDASLSSDFPPFSSIDASTISALLDSQPQAEQESDMILAPSYPPISQPNVFPNHSFDPTPITDITAPIGSYSSFPSDSLLPLSSVALPLVPQSLPSVFEDESILSMPGYMGLEPSPASTSSSFADPVMGGPFYSGSMSSTMSGERLAFYPVPAALETLQNPVTEYQGDYQGFYGPHGTLHQRIFCNSGDSQLVNGCVSPTTLNTDVPSLDESSFKVGRLSVEERREKIHRYMKKRNERNFSKKIKYACRKTLADSRPRVRGRFAKNDEFGETTRSGSGNNEDEDEEDLRLKEEDDAMDSSELFAHLGTMNSFKCNYTLESWI